MFFLIHTFKQDIFYSEVTYSRKALAFSFVELITVEKSLIVQAPALSLVFDICTFEQ